jgi:hypothetical protein
VAERHDARFRQAVRLVNASSPSTVERFFEYAAPLGIQANDFAVENGVFDSQL